MNNKKKKRKNAESFQREEVLGEGSGTGLFSALKVRNGSHKQSEFQLPGHII
jgi:hypothetical protein